MRSARSTSSAMHRSLLRERTGAKLDERSATYTAMISFA
jgi:hypothetical protein